MKTEQNRNMKINNGLVEVVGKKAHNISAFVEPQIMMNYVAID